jgi:phosphatidylinositol-bisphosphatase
VANKILKKSLGSNDYFADLEIPGDKSRPKKESMSLMRHFSEKAGKYKLFVGSWNVGGIAPPDGLNIDDLITIPNYGKADIYVLGFQEIVPLSAGNVLGSDNGKVCMQWNSVIRAGLNKKAEDIVSKVQVGEFQKVHPLKKNKSVKNSGDFQCIISKQMVGIFITVWARTELCINIKHASVSCVGCGIMGCLGNKGSVAVRFYLHETSFCFVCSHLASGGKEGDERQRNSDASEILARTTFPRGPFHELPRKILHHDRVIWLGDLNYRIYLPEERTRLLVNRQEWNILLQNDQLKTELMEGHVFEGWQEETINFAPTYKYYPNSDDYYGLNQDGKEKKLRTPAWCDRIIWIGKGLKQKQYSRGESRLSDHRPVRAIFKADVKVLKSTNSSESLLSNRFNHLSNHFNVCISTSKFLCNGMSSIQ